MRFSLIAAPLELGCGTTGCAMGGAALVSGENGLLSFLSHNGIAAAADSAFVPLTVRRAEEPSPHYLAEVLSACAATRDAVSAAQGAGVFPVTLGGDHALGLGTVAGTAQHYSPEELSLIWVDAHTDINTEDSSESGNIHGMPIAALLGLCDLLARLLFAPFELPVGVVMALLGGPFFIWLLQRRGRIHD